MGISFNHVTHLYPGVKRKEYTLALEDVSLDINEKNEFIAIVGKTGSGKSTLIQHMNALKLPTKGTVSIFDNIITPKKRKNPKLKNVRKRVGFVFQFPEYQLFEETVLKDIMFAPINFGMKKEEAEKKALEIAKLLGISHLLKKSPFNLSGGQMRRVAIAGILAINPDIIILDEPTVGLDPKGKDTLMNLLVDIQKKTHKSIIIISHDMNVVARYAKRIIVMKQSRIVYDGEKRRLFEDLDKLHEYNLDLPTVCSLSMELKKKNLINYKHLPLTIEELETVIKGGDIYE